MLYPTVFWYCEPHPSRLRLLGTPDQSNVSRSTMTCQYLLLAGLCTFVLAGTRPSGAPGGDLPLSCDRQSPVQLRSGLAATEEWW